MSLLSGAKTFAKYTNPFAFAGDLAKDVVDPKTDVISGVGRDQDPSRGYVQGANTGLSGMPSGVTFGGPSLNVQDAYNRGGISFDQPQNESPTNPLNLSLGGSGAGTPAYDPIELELINTQIRNAQAGLGRIGNQRDIGLSNILGSFTDAQNQLNQQRGIAERDYNTTKQQTGEDYTNSRAGIRAQAGNQFTGLQRLLGGFGSGRSSAAQILAPFAVGREAAQRFGQVEDSYGRNQQAIDTGYGDSERQYKTLAEQIAEDKRRKERELEQGLQSSQVDLNNQLAGLELSKQSLLGGGLNDVRSALNPYQSRVQELLSSIDNLGRQYQNSVKPTGQVKFAAPDLAQYNYSQFQAPTVGGQANPVNDYTSPIANLLAREEEEKNRV